MALIKCKECGKEISDTADKCIHCGCPLHNENNNGNKQVSNVYIWLVAILPFLSVLLLWVVWYLLESYFIGMIIMIIVFCILSIVLIKLDYTSLKNRGVDVTPFGKFSLFKIVIPKYIYKRANILKQSLSYFVVWLICVIFYCIVIVVGFNPLSLLNYSVKQIQSSYIYDCPDYTVKELIDTAIKNPKWKSETNFDGESLVIVSGQIDYDGEEHDIFIEYTIRGEEFGITDIKVDNESLDSDSYEETIEYICDVDSHLYNENGAYWQLKNYKYKKISKLTYDQYDYLYNSDEPFVMIITQSTCDYSARFLPIMDEYASENDVPVYILELDSIGEEDFKKVLSSLNYFEDNNAYAWGTPLTLAIKDKVVVNDLVGFTDKQSDIDDFFKSIYG